MPWLSPMAGAGLAGLGALAGGFNEQLNKNQQLRRQQLLDQMALEEFRQKQREYQQKLQTEAGIFAGLSQMPLAPVTGGGPMAWGGAPDTMSPPSLAAPTMPGTNLGVGGGITNNGMTFLPNSPLAGMNNPGAVSQFFSDAAASGTPVGSIIPDSGGLKTGGAISGRAAQLAREGLSDPDLLLSEKYESGGRNIPNYRYDPTHTAGGNLQITDSTWREEAPRAGVDLTRYPNAMSADRPVQFAVSEQLKQDRGTQPWDDFNAKLRAARASGETFTQKMVQAGANPQQAQAGFNRANVMIPPQFRGSLSGSQIAEIVNRTSPNADAATKGLIAEGLMKFANEQTKQEWDQYKFGIGQQEKAREFDIRERELRQNREETQQYRKDTLKQRESAKWQVMTDPSNNQQYRYNAETGEAKSLTGNEPYNPGGAQKLGSGQAGKMGRVANITAYKGGQMVFEGSAQYTPHGWVNTATGQPIPEADRVDEVKGAGTGSGGRAGAQVQRQLISAKEVISDLTNAMNLPISSTRGIFGGRVQGPGLLDALKENMAETATPEEDELMQSSLSGLFRELSIVVSPVYGGHWAADSFAALGIKPGQTNAVKLYNLARMRQTVDNALEGVQNTDWVGKEQKEYAKQLQAELAKAVPFTPADVIAFRSRADDEQTFSDFVKQNQIGGGQKPQGQPQPGGVIKLDENGNVIQ